MTKQKTNPNDHLLISGHGDWEARVDHDLAANRMSLQLACYHKGETTIAIGMDMEHFDGNTYVPQTPAPSLVSAKPEDVRNMLQAIVDAAATVGIYATKTPIEETERTLYQDMVEDARRVRDILLMNGMDTQGPITLSSAYDTAGSMTAKNSLHRNKQHFPH